jgi:hypothetical protein
MLPKSIALIASLGMPGGSAVARKSVLRRIRATPSFGVLPGWNSILQAGDGSLAGSEMPFSWCA